MTPNINSGVKVIAPALVVDVVGTPAPQGSKSYMGHRNGRALLIESCRAVRPWRAAVAAAVQDAIPRESWVRLDGPVAVSIEFFLARPASAPKSRLYPGRRPDLDKLERSTLDALTMAGAFEDDARVVEMHSRKLYAGTFTGAQIEISAAC